jgi:hypothetical protein
MARPVRISRPLAPRHSCRTLGVETSNTKIRAMQVTKSVLCLWVGCAISAACATFIFGAGHVAKLMTDGGIYDGGDGPLNISINLPIFGVEMIGVIAAVVALIGLLLSWLWNKHALFSRQHVASLLFLLPLFLDLLVWRDV